MFIYVLHSFIVLRQPFAVDRTFKIYLVSLLVSKLVGALSPVNHKGLYQG